MGITHGGSLRTGFLICAIALLAWLGPAAGEAAGLEKPAGPVVLTVNGALSQSNAAGAASFDMDMLRRMDSVSFVTHTIWTRGPQEFTGVPLAALLSRLDAKGTEIRALAINDYTIDIPFDEMDENAPIIAYERNGMEMSIRDKGPLWIVYPYDSNPAYSTELVYSRSIWHLVRIDLPG